MDNLKVILIAAVIAGHAILGYSELDAWSYADVREVTLRPAVAYALLAVAAPFALLVIPLLFLIAGLLTPPSLDRKGPGRFIRDRLLRLGVPFAVFALLLWPLLEYVLFRQLGEAPGLWTYFRAEGSLDTGVLWFVGALLTFSLGYAGWVWVRRGHEARPRLGEIKVGHLLLLAARGDRRDVPGPTGAAVRKRQQVRRSEHVGMARVRGAVRTGHHGISCRVADGRSGPPPPTESDCNSRGRWCGGCVRCLRESPWAWPGSSCGAAGTGPPLCSPPVKAHSRCSDRCGCSASRSDASTGRFGGPVR